MIFKMSRRKGYIDTSVPSIDRNRCIDDLNYLARNNYTGDIVLQNGNTYLKFEGKMYYLGRCDYYLEICDGDNYSKTLHKYLESIYRFNSPDNTSVILSNIKRVVSGLWASRINSPRMIVYPLVDCPNNRSMIMCLGFDVSANDLCGFTHYAVYADTNRVLWILLDRAGSGFYTASSPPYEITKADIQGMASIRQEVIVPPMNSMCTGAVLLPMFGPFLFRESSSIFTQFGMTTGYFFELEV